MDITVKLGAALVRFRPETATRNTFPMKVPDNCSAQDVLGALGIGADQPVMLIINDTLIGPEQRTTYDVSADDTLAIMTPIHAG